MIDLTAAVRQAERDIVALGTEHPVSAFLLATAPTRPGPGQPGTLAEELHAANVFLHLPTEARRNRRAALRACRAHAIPHCRPIDQQAKEWWAPKPQARPAATRKEAPKVRIRRDA